MNTEAQQHPDGYLLPGPIAIAVMSNRPGLAQTLIPQLQEGVEIPPPQLVGMVRLIADLLADRSNLQDGLEEANRKIYCLHDGLNSIRQAIVDLETDVESA